MIPEDWEVKPLKDVGHPLIGLTYSPRDVREAGTLVLRSSNVQNGHLAFGDNVFVDPTVATKALVQKNDILICVRNGSRELIGKCAKVDHRAHGMAFGAFMSIFRSSDHGFVFHQFRSDSMRRQINEHLGATINQITNGSLNGFKIAWPSTESERDKIAEALSEVDEAIVAQEAVIAKKRALKTATMQALLSGTRRLPGFSGEWEVKALGLCLKVRHGKSQAAVESVNGKYPILATGGEIGRADAYLHPGPSVLIGRKGTIDRPQYSEGPFWSIDTLFYTEIDASADAKFLFYKFQMIDWRTYNEASGVPSLSSTTIETIEVEMPDREEQSAIADVITDFDLDLEQNQAKLAKLIDLKSGMMQQLLTGKIRLV